MGKLHKVSPKECKEEAVRLAPTSGKPIAQMARELGISAAAMQGWRQELAEHGKEAFPGKGHQTELEARTSSPQTRTRKGPTGAGYTKKVVGIFSRASK